MARFFSDKKIRRYAYEQCVQGRNADQAEKENI